MKRNQFFRRLLCLLLSAGMVIGMLPAAAAAAAGPLSPVLIGEFSPDMLVKSHEVIAGDLGKMFYNPPGVGSSDIQFQVEIFPETVLTCEMEGTHMKLVPQVAEGEADVTLTASNACTDSENPPTVVDFHVTIDSKLEAETYYAASKSSQTFLADDGNASGGRFVDGFSRANARAVFDVDVGHAGTYTLTFCYSNQMYTGEHSISLYVNGSKQKRILTPQTSNWSVYRMNTTSVDVTLREGVNSIAFQRDLSDSGQMRLDYINLAFKNGNMGANRPPMLVDASLQLETAAEDTSSYDLNQYFGDLDTDALFYQAALIGDSAAADLALDGSTLRITGHIPGTYQVSVTAYDRDPAAGDGAMQSAAAKFPLTVLADNRYYVSDRLTDADKARYTVTWGGSKLKFRDYDLGGGRVAWFDWGQSGESYVDVTFDVPEDGDYSFFFNYSVSGNASDSYNYYVDLLVNGTMLEQKYLVNGNSWSVYKDSKTWTVPLKEGKNTIRFADNPAYKTNLQLYYVQVSGMPAPVAPTGLRVEERDGAAVLTWDRSQNASTAAYQVYVNGAAAATVTQPAEGDTVTFRYNNVQDGQTYAFAVSVKNSGGMESAQSTPVTLAARPIIPGGLTAALLEAGGALDGVRLTWDTSATAQSYELYEGDTLLGTVPADLSGIQQAYEHRGQTEGAEYVYKVVAVNGGRKSEAAETSVRYQRDALLWRLGTPDDSSTEFSDYGGNVELDIPAGWEEQTDWSAVPKGLHAVTGAQMKLHYNLDSIPENGLLMQVKILDAHQCIPQMAVFSNGTMAGMLQITGLSGNGADPDEFAGYRTDSKTGRLIGKLADGQGGYGADFLFDINTLRLVDESLASYDQNQVLYTGNHEFYGNPNVDIVACNGTDGNFLEGADGQRYPVHLFAEHNGMIRFKDAETIVGQAYPQNQVTKFKTTYRLYIPKEMLKTGRNELLLRTDRGLYATDYIDQFTWWEWDYLSLSALAAPISDPIHGRYNTLSTSLEAPRGADRSTGLHFLPFGVKWLGFAYTGSYIRYGNWYGAEYEWESSNRQYLELHKQLNVEPIALYISGTITREGNDTRSGPEDQVAANGYISEKWKEQIAGYFTQYGSLLGGVEIENEPGLFKTTKRSLTAFTKWLDESRSDYAPHLKLIAPGWAFRQETYARVPEQRADIDGYADMIGGHSYAGTAVEQPRGGLLSETLLSHPDFGDGYGKELFISETGCSDGHGFGNAAQVYYAEAQNTAVFDRELRGNLGFARHQNIHAGWYPEFAVFEDANDWDHYQVEEIRQHEAPAAEVGTETRANVLRRLNGAYGTHGKPLAYRYTEADTSQYEAKYVRAVDTSTLPALATGAKSDKVLVTFTNFERRDVTFDVKIKMPEATPYKGERYGPGLTLGEALSYTDALVPDANGELVFHETLAAGDTVQYILQAQDIAAPTAPEAFTGTYEADGWGKVVLNWAPSYDDKEVARYVLYRAEREKGTDEAFSPFTKRMTVSGVTYTDNAVSNGKEYRYMLRAVDFYGNESPESEVVQVVLPDLDDGNDSTVPFVVNVHYNNPKMAYAGDAWVRDDGARFAQTTEEPDSVSFTFEGSAFALYGDAAADAGRFDVYVDGKIDGENVNPAYFNEGSNVIVYSRSGLDTYKKDPATGETVLDQEGLEDGLHTVRIVFKDGGGKRFRLYKATTSSYPIGAADYEDFIKTNFPQPSAPSSEAIEKLENCIPVPYALDADGNKTDGLQVITKDDMAYNGNVQHRDTAADPLIFIRGGAEAYFNIHVDKDEYGKNQGYFSATMKIKVTSDTAGFQIKRNGVELITQQLENTGGKYVLLQTEPFYMEPGDASVTIASTGGSGSSFDLEYILFDTPYPMQDRDDTGRFLLPANIEAGDMPKAVLKPDPAVEISPALNQQSDGSVDSALEMPLPIVYNAAAAGEIPPAAFTGASGDASAAGGAVVLGSGASAQYDVFFNYSGFYKFILDVDGAAGDTLNIKAGGRVVAEITVPEGGGAAAAEMETAHGSAHIVKGADVLAFEAAAGNAGSVTINSIRVEELPLPDLIVQGIAMEPAQPTAGDAVQFRAEVRNAGRGAWPEGVIVGIPFKIPGLTTTWHDATTDGLAPGEVRVLAANSGGAGSSQITPDVGNYTVTAQADDQQRHMESVYSNNFLSMDFAVASLYSTARQEYDASLKELSVEEGVLSPAFHSGVYAYNVSVPAGTAAVTLKTVLFDDGAQIKINGEAAEAGTQMVAVQPGTQVITIETFDNRRYIYDEHMEKQYIEERRTYTVRVTVPEEEGRLSMRICDFAYNTDTGKLRYAVYNPGPAREVSCYAALYRDGALLQVHRADINAEAGAETPVTQDLAMTEGANQIKLFIWDEYMTPYAYTTTEKF